MPSFGEELKRERELRRITLREVAETTKINLRYLEALEKNDFEHLPGGVFNRGFVRAYAQFIGVDPEAMVTAYLLEEKSQSGDDEVPSDSGLRRGTGAPATPESLPAAPPPDREASDGAAVGRWILIGLVLAIVLAAGALWVVRSASDAPPPATVSGVGSDTSPSAKSANHSPSNNRDKVDPANNVGANGNVAPSPPPAEKAGATEEAPQNPATADGDRAATQVASLDEPPKAQQPNDERDLEPSARTPAAPQVEPEPAAPGTITVTVRLERATRGRLNCDNRRIELLNGIRAGKSLTLRCKEFLAIDAVDAGAVWISKSGGPEQPLGEDGVSVRNHRVDLTSPTGGNGP